MKELPYFKFYTGEWMKGDITDCSMAAQGLFINICALYWSRGCDLDLTRVERKFNGCSTSVQELVNDEIIGVIDDKIVINFLDEQFEQFGKLRKQKSRAGKASAKKRKGNRRSTGVEQALNNKEEIREEEIREEKNIPAWEEFKEYGVENKPKVNIQSLQLKYKSWVENGWKDGNGKKIVNWKSKLLNTLPHIEEVQTTGRQEKHEIPKGYGQPSDTAIPMPKDLKKRLLNIGEESQSEQ